MKPSDFGQKVEVIYYSNQSMKKLYAFLITLLALGVISSGVVQAQSYTINSYIVHKVDVPDPAGLGSGPNWHSIGAATTVPASLYNYFPYYYFGVSQAIQVPFPIRFANQQLTTTNTIEVSGNGSVILSPTWNP